jgi:catechol 2,3-dioxygenase-like lactoylglutathione lyase family enzyme
VPALYQYRHEAGGSPPGIALGVQKRQGAMSVTSLDHVNILSADVPRTVGFLTSVLGLEDGPRPPFRSPGAWLYANGIAVVHVSSAGDKERTHAGDASLGDSSHVPAPASVDHVAFRCTGYRETMARLRALGIPAHESEVPGRGDRQVFVDGPDVSFELIFSPADVAR